MFTISFNKKQDFYIPLVTTILSEHFFILLFFLFFGQISGIPP